MASNFKNAIVPALGTTETTVVTTLSNARTTVIGMSLTNVTVDPVQVSIKLNDTVQTAAAYFLKNVIVPPNQSLRVVNGGEKLILAPNNSIAVVCNTVDGLDVIASYVEIT